MKGAAPHPRPQGSTLAARLLYLARRVERLGRKQRDAEASLLEREAVAIALRSLAWDVRS